MASVSSPNYNAATTTTPSENCFTNYRSFVRVRPYKDNREMADVPPEQILVRPAVEYEPSTSTITVLDPNNKFKPRKNGEFHFSDASSVLWSFEDVCPSLPQPPRQLQADVYSRVVTPIIPSLKEGYGCAFIAYGAADAGKMTTMFGDESWSPYNKGLFPRIAEEVFDVVNEHIREEEAQATVEVEVIELQGDNFVDLLASKKVNAELKVREDPMEGPVLHGATRVLVTEASSLNEVVKSATRGMRRRKNTFAVTLRIVETYVFKDPENSDTAEISKSRRIFLHFIVLRNLSPSVARCFDVAVERDTENPAARVPIRDTNFAKLYADIFNGNVNVSVISCVSPYYRDVKDTHATLTFAGKICKIKTYPRLNHDSSMLELRRLADEMKDMERHVTKTNESIIVVQDELDRRQIELERQERMRAELREMVKDVSRIGTGYSAFRERECKKFKKDTAKRDETLFAMRKEIDNVRNEARNTLRDTEALKSQVAERDAHVQTIIEEQQKQEAANALYNEELELFRAEEKDVKRMESYLNASPEERLTEVNKLAKESLEVKKRLPRRKEERNEVQQELQISRSVEATVEANWVECQEEARELEEKRIIRDRKRKEVAELEAEIERMRKDIERMEEENKNAPKGCCTVM